MFSRFFIDRPIFSVVISILIVLAGLLAMRVLPIAQYPEIAPPVVTVRAVYPGASATVLEQTVAAPLENAINGIEDMMYMSSTSASNGVLEIQVTFEIGDDFATGATSLNDHRMVYSYDQQNWSFFDNNFRTPTANKFTFANSSAFTQDTVYVAYGQPYPFQRVVDDTASLAGSEWVAPTTSGDANLIIGQSPGGIDDIGRVESHPLTHTILIAALASVHGDVDAVVFEDTLELLHVRKARHVCVHQRLARQDGRDHQWQSGILGARNRNLAPQLIAADQTNAIHVVVP